MLRIGLIGCGFMGAMHADCYRNIPDASVCAVADVRREKAEAIAKDSGASVYETGMELIEKSGADVIDICLPTCLHAEHALKAMEKARYLFIEKPVALTGKEAEALLEKSRETGCRVQVGQVIRFWDEYITLRDMIKENRYGKVINANFRRISPTPTWGWNDWLRNVPVSGGAALDMHIHDMDFVLSLFGQPKKLYSVKNRLGEKNSYINTLMEYDSFPVSVESTWDLPSSHPFSATFRVVFENAVAENDAGGFVLYTDGGAKKIEPKKTEFESQNNAGGNISDLGGYFNELSYFVSKAKENAPIEQATLEDGVSSLLFLLNKELPFGD